MSAALELDQVVEQRPKLADVQTFRPLQGYKPHKGQRVMHALRTQHQKRFRHVKSGRRAGKTRGAGADFVDSSLHDYVDRRQGTGRYMEAGPTEFAGWKGSDPEPLLHYWVVAPTHELLGEPARYLQRYFGLEADGGLILDQDRSRGIWRVGDGIRVDFRSAERPELLVSRGLDGVWGDEVARWKQDVWTEHLQPALMDKRGWLLDTTTPLGRNWYWRHLWCLGDPVEAAIASEDGDVVRVDPEHACAEWWTEYNTCVPGLAAEVAAARHRMPLALWRRSFRAAFDAFKGQVFDLSRNDHLCRVRWLRSAFDLGIVAGYDHGWTHPGVLTIWGVRSTPPYFVELETVSRRQTPVTSVGEDGWRDIMTRLASKWDVAEVYVPQDAKEAAYAFRQAGMRVRSAYQDCLAGLQWFQTCLHNKWAVFSSPQVLARFSGLKHPDGFGAGSELWVKEDDDEFDAGRYALTRWIRGGRLPGRGQIRLAELAMMR